jgi:hypothetical protein
MPTKTPLEMAFLKGVRQGNHLALARKTKIPGRTNATSDALLHSKISRYAVQIAEIAKAKISIATRCDRFSLSDRALIGSL